MKKNFIAAAIATAASLMTFNALASDGTINFTGEIINEGCTIDLEGKDALNVVLGKVAKSAFVNQETASTTTFVIKAINCPTGINSATVKFEAEADASNINIMKLTQEEGVAQGVGIQLTDANETIVPMRTESSSYALSSTEVNELRFAARYIRTGTAEAIVAGPANATSTFTLNYQ